MRTYASITLHPARSHDGRDAISYHEAWGQWDDSDAIIGFLYTFPNGYVWLNEQGHPSELFTERADMVAWLQAHTPCLTWSEEPRR